MQSTTQQRAIRQMVLWGLTAIMVVGFLGLAPGLASHQQVRAAPLGSGAPVAAARVAAPPAPTTLTPFQPLPSSQQQLLVPPTIHSVSMGPYANIGPHPAAWGSSGVAPGAAAIQPSPQSWGGGGGSSGGSSNTAGNWNNRLCAGLWPYVAPGLWGKSSQGTYASGCYGHDEPGIQFQSDLPGSGGNVTWNITLPTDRDAFHNQSDLYSAMWFGMTMNDPFGWMDQCFLELQFYPDQTWYNPFSLYYNYTVNGAWIGAAVAWQIEAATGAENPCFYEPLYLNGVPGPAYLNMTQGDRIQVTMTGYTTSTVGEQVTITDQTNGQVSNFTMYNTAQGYPIDPSYSTSNYQASMQWTPGGEFPVSFAFETGHAGNTNWPSNNSYGGCSGGTHSTPTDPGAPCPSYDPGSWANDTKTPWLISPPTFFNAGAQAHPVQVSFTQPEGGMNLVDQTANGACTGIEGSAWCSYPWYSYYCAAHVFEFGAVDYTGYTTDFGQWHQFDRNSVTLSNGGSFFPPTNFSTPSCGAPSATLSFGPSVAGTGSVYFLSTADSTATTVPGLLHGTYSLNAIPASGMKFSHWVVTGGSFVDISTSPYTTLHVAGSGTVRAVFASTVPTTTVTFRDFGSGAVGLDGNWLWLGSDHGLATLATGQNWSLAPGMYSIQAYPKPGWNFSYWTFSGGVTVTATHFPYTQLIVNGKSSTATVAAWYSRSTATGTVYLYAIGVGTVSFGNASVTNTAASGYNGIVATLPVGTYRIGITDGPGVLGWQILYGSPLIISNNAMHTWGNIEGGAGVLEVVFTSGAQVTFQVNPHGAGTIFGQGASGFVAVTSGSTVTLPLGIYGGIAQAAPGYAFSGWTTNASSVIGFSGTTPYAFATVLGNGTIVANFLKTTTTSTLSLHVGPRSGAGTITYNMGSTYGSGTTLRKTTAGQYVVVANAKPGWTFLGWVATGAASIVGSASGTIAVVSLVSGSGGLSANFVPTLVPLSFALWNPHGVTPLHGSIIVNGVRVVSGEWVWVRMGSTVTVSLKNAAPLSSWVADGGVTVVSSTATSATLLVTTGGTIEADLT